MQSNLSRKSWRIRRYSLLTVEAVTTPLHTNSNSEKPTVSRKRADKSRVEASCNSLSRTIVRISIRWIKDLTSKVLEVAMTL